MLKKLLSATPMVVHGARTTSLDPLQKYKFRLTVPGIPTEIGFQKVSGLTHEVGVAEYTEGVMTMLINFLESLRLVK